MADIGRIVDLYDLYKSYRRVARELKVSRNTVKKYVLKVKEVQDGVANEILPKNRGIIQPSQVLTEPVRQKIHGASRRITHHALILNMNGKSFRRR